MPAPRLGRLSRLLLLLGPRSRRHHHRAPGAHARAHLPRRRLPRHRAHAARGGPAGRERVLGPRPRVRGTRCYYTRFIRVVIYAIFLLVVVVVVIIMIPASSASFFVCFSSYSYSSSSFSPVILFPCIHRGEGEKGGERERERETEDSALAHASEVRVIYAIFFLDVVVVVVAIIMISASSASFFVCLFFFFFFFFLFAGDSLSLNS